jgi:anti-sigma regulatory factor (Ser/Thr protein kinase)
MSYVTAAHVEARARAVRPAGRAVDVCLAAVPEAARAARSAVVDALTGHVDDRVLGDAELLVSELVSNSVRHAGLGAGELVRVGLAVSDGVVRLEVENPGSTGTIAAHEPDPDGGGFGLLIVEALAHAWGISRDGHTRVWVELLCWPATEALQA